MFQNFKSEIKLFLIVAAISMVLATGVIFLLNNSQGVVSNQVTHTPASTPSLQPQAVDTSDITLSEVEGWQTYRNGEFGFELQYPRDWRIRIRSDGIIDISPDPEKSDLSTSVGFIDIEPFPLTESETPEDIIIESISMGESVENPDTFEVFSERKFGDTSFFYIHNYLSEGQHGGVYYIVGKKQVLAIRFIALIDMDIFSGEKSFTATREEQEEAIETGPVHSILKQILSTFRFVE
jgi:hypothetical protein